MSKKQWKYVCSACDILALVVIAVLSSRMPDRFDKMLPSFIGVGALLLVTMLLNFVIQKKFATQMNSLEWIANHRGKSVLMGAPYFYIAAPAKEEIIFRAPLLIAFSTMSRSAWTWLIISSAIFSLLHLSNPRPDYVATMDKREKGALATDNAAEELKRSEQERSRRGLRIQQLAHLLITFIFGTVIGYVGIRTQSFWYCFGFHALFNLFWPILILLLAAIALSPVFLWTMVMKWRLRRELMSSAQRFGLFKRRT